MKKISVEIKKNDFLNNTIFYIVKKKNKIINVANKVLKKMMKKTFDMKYFASLKGLF